MLVRRCLNPREKAAGAYRINNVFGANRIIDVVALYPIIDTLYGMGVCDGG